MFKKAFSYVGFPFRWFFSFLGDKIYDLKVLIYSKRKKKDIKEFKNRNKLMNALFYWGFLIIPLIFFVLTHFIINGNSILLAFQKMDGNGNVFFAGLENFSRVFSELKGESAPFSTFFKNSLIAYGLGLTLTPITITFSYYVYKKCFGSTAFKIMLFLPTIFSSVISVYIYKVLANRVLPAIMLNLFDKDVQGYVKNPDTLFAAVMFYTIWMGLGNSLLTNLAAMNTVDPSVSEASMLDGVGFFGELWHIVMPASYTVIMLGLITGVTNIFGNTLNLFAFNGFNVDWNARTVGYHIQVLTVKAADMTGLEQFTEYAFLSAWGVFVTAIAVPTTFLIKHLIYKVGPSEE